MTEQYEILKLNNLNILLEQNKFQPRFYWTGDTVIDAERINRPHIIAEGECENRIVETIEIIDMFKNNPDFDGRFEIWDVFNIQNFFLKKNNYKCIKPAYRTHEVGFKGTPHWNVVPQLLHQLFPVSFTTKEDLLLWYTVVQKIHPLSDLNGRVFGTIVAILYKP